MNIVLTFDNNFIPQAAACAASVCANNRDCGDLTFYLMALNAEEERLGKLRKYIEENGGSVQVIELSRIQDYFDFSVDTAGWNPIVLARLLLDRLLPESAGRVLYLDCDIIVRKNLKELWETDLNGCVLGACMEPTCAPERREALGIRKAPYYNAGVLLIDLGKYREIHAGEKILAFYKEAGGSLFANDQDAINGSLKDSILPLSCTYNYHNTYDLYRYRLLEKNCDYPVPSREELERIKADPAIVHFLGEERPWRAGNTNRFRDEYHHYLSLTPFADTPDEPGWNRYFFCWRIFNFMMRPFPMTRLRIINSLIPRMVEKRHGR